MAKDLVESLKPKSADKLFTQFKVDQAGANILASTQFQKWATAVTKANANSPGLAEMTIVTTLITRYGDEAVANMLVAARGIHKSDSTVAKLENAQLTAWLASEKTADEVFTLLKLDEKGIKLFESPAVNSWALYMAKLGVQNPDEAMFLALKARYDDASLVKMLVQAKDIRSTRDVAEGIEAVQLYSWARDGKTADEVFKLLKLEGNGAKLLESPALHAWISYVQILQKDPYELLLVRLQTLYDDGALVTKILIPAKEEASTKAIAGGLQKALLKDWSSKDVSIGKAFLLLRLGEKGSWLFKSPAGAVWVSYVNEVNGQHLAFSRLELHFGDVQLARMLCHENLHAELTKAKEMKVFTDTLLHRLCLMWNDMRLTPERLVKRLGAFDARDTRIILLYSEFYDRQLADLPSILRLIS